MEILNELLKSDTFYDRFCQTDLLPLRFWLPVFCLLPSSFTGVYTFVYLSGCVFLWLYWPSFNGGATSGDEQHRAVINTYLSLAACTIVTFAISAMLDNKGRFDMVSRLFVGMTDFACVF